jgi:hypothetical protein
MPAALYLAWKYHDDFAAGLTANATVGGDNCHRGAVVGSLLGVAEGGGGSAGFSRLGWLEGAAD